eukprot:3672899-Rhodomonas_salina.1
MISANQADQVTRPTPPTICSYAMHGTETALGAVSSLRASYAVSGTKVAYGCPIPLYPSYAMCGIEIGYAGAGSSDARDASPLPRRPWPRPRVE